MIAKVCDHEKQARLVVREPPCYPSTGLKLGVVKFSRDQNRRGLSGAYITCIYCSLSMKINMCKMPNDALRL